ncbi:hypothetical protein J2Z23_000350 [Lederbergia galactosidilyticus]|nr:hypothetical protein [Lederbergia galactosidilytica]
MFLSGYLYRLLPEGKSIGKKGKANENYNNKL